MDTQLIINVVNGALAIGALVLAWMAWHRPAAQVHPEQAKRELIQAAAEDGIILATQAAKKNLANGHELGDTAKLKIAVGHFLQVTERHGFRYTEAEAARVVETTFGRQKAPKAPLPPAGPMLRPPT